MDLQSYASGPFVPYFKIYFIDANFIFLAKQLSD